MAGESHDGADPDVGDPIDRGRRHAHPFRRQHVEGAGSHERDRPGRQPVRRHPGQAAARRDVALRERTRVDRPAARDRPDHRPAEERAGRVGDQARAHRVDAEDVVDPSGRSCGVAQRIASGSGSGSSV
ncbi:MAG: hypothetical protein WCK58_15330 [Chloroflexota bacterium]